MLEKFKKSKAANYSVGQLLESVEDRVKREQKSLLEAQVTAAQTFLKSAQAKLNEL